MVWFVHILYLLELADGVWKVVGCNDFFLWACSLAWYKHTWKHRNLMERLPSFPRTHHKPIEVNIWFRGRLDISAMEQGLLIHILLKCLIINAAVRLVFPQVLVLSSVYYLPGLCASERNWRVQNRHCHFFIEKVSLHTLFAKHFLVVLGL